MPDGLYPEQANIGLASLQAAFAGAEGDFSSYGPGITVLPCVTTCIEILVRDEDDNPVTDQAYHLELTDGSVVDGVLGPDGRIYADARRIDLSIEPLHEIPRSVCTVGGRAEAQQTSDFGVPPRSRGRGWRVTGC